MPAWEYPIHRNCGGEVQAELLYSDALNDYYAPVCEKCGSSPHLRECIFPNDLGGVLATLHAPI